MAMRDGLDLLAEAVGALGAEDDLQRPGLGGELVDLYALTHQLQAQISRRLAAFDRRGDSVLDGHRSVKGWLADKCRLDGGEAWRALKTARAMDSLEGVRALWESGSTTTGHIQLVVRVRTHAKADEQFDALEPTWEWLCREHDTATLSIPLAAFVDRLDNTKPRPEQDNVKAIDRRSIVGSRCLGVGLLEGRFDVLDYDLVMRTLEWERKRSHVEGDERTVEQERADAFVSICRRALSEADNTESGIAGVLAVVDVPTLQGLEAGMCQTDSGLALSIDSVRRLCCGNPISRVLVDAEGAVLDFGMSKRLFNRAQRHAMVVRDGGCTFPRCLRKAHQCEAHHLKWWEHGGPTDFINGTLVCWAHHRLVHDLGWRIERNESGGVDWFKPDGSHHSTWAPPGRLPPLPLPHERAA
jgi:hypothetical protein